MNIKKFTHVLCLLSLVASGCATQNPFTKGSEEIGTTLCGAADSMMGKLLGQRIANAAIGRTSTVLCAGRSYYFDKQVQELRKKLNGANVKIIRTEENIRLVLFGNNLFVRGSNKISVSYYPVIDSIIYVLQQYRNTKLFVQGHTDSSGAEFNNLTLSTERANNVASYMMYKGVSKKRMSIEGYGEKYPISEDSIQNRRVEVLISF